MASSGCEQSHVRIAVKGYRLLLLIDLISVVKLVEAIVGFVTVVELVVNLFFSLM